MSGRHVVVVGGGAAGSAVFGELLSRDDGGTVHWVAACANLGRGVAYATDDERHLLNVRAGGMGLFGCHDEDFTTYASRRHVGAKATDFLPRRLFGDFVQAQLRARVRPARRGGRRFVIHDDEACRIEARGGAYHVQLRDGGRLAADVVVLAIGALPPRPLRSVSAAVLASGAYLLDPWNLDASTAPPRRLLVIGTGLTAVDTLLTASVRWPDAELLAVSRHGLLPLAHVAAPPAAWPSQERLNAALSSATAARDMLRLVRAALHDAGVQSTDWRSVIDGMRPINVQLWQNLSLPQRRRFLRHLRWIWEAARHRTAPRSAQAIGHLVDQGRLRVHAARVLAVEAGPPLRVCVRHRATQARSTLEADLVVQATGLDTAVAYAGHALMGQLIEDGLIRPDPLRLGITVLPDGRVIHAGGRVQHGLYAIGSLLRGCLWECSAMPEIRAAAHRLAATLVPRPPVAGEEDACTDA